MLPVSVSRRGMLGFGVHERGERIRTDKDEVHDEEVGADWEGEHGKREGEEFVDYGARWC